MHKLILENGGPRQHRQSLKGLLETTSGSVRVASAYVTDADLLSVAKTRKVQLLTSLLRMDIVSGATSLDSLKLLIENGVQCRCLSDGPRLHAKTYIFANEGAVVTSANLTRSALDRNIEVGVQISGDTVQELMKWFDQQWDKAVPLDAAQIAVWQKETAKLRHDYSRLRKKMAAAPKLPNEASPIDVGPEALASLRELLTNINRPSPNRVPSYFCNTDRKHGGRDSSGRFLREELMRSRGYAAAWEEFSYPGHMEKVQVGQAILMYANRVGIIGIGRAKSACEILTPDRAERLLGAEESTEWRIPVDWLAWVKDDGACPWTPPALQTFIDVCDTKFDTRRKVVREHFLSGSVLVGEGLL